MPPTHITNKYKSIDMFINFHPPHHIAFLNFYSTVILIIGTHLMTSNRLALDNDLLIMCRASTSPYPLEIVNFLLFAKWLLPLLGCLKFGNTYCFMP